MKSTLNWTLLFAVALVAVLIARDVTAAAPVAHFDWSMPDRLVIDASSQMTVDVEAAPATWHVDFNACASGPNAVEYRWTIAGYSVSTTTVTTDCLWSFEFPSEGVFIVSLVVAAADGAISPPITQNVTVQDFLIVALGDSYGSGEGNPDVPIPPGVLESWLGAVAQHAQAMTDLAHAQEVLAALQTIIGPVSDLVQAQEDMADASARVGTYCGFLFYVPYYCELANADLADATLRNTELTAEVTLVVTEASIVQGLEDIIDFIPSPENLKAHVEDLMAAWSSSVILLARTIEATLEQIRELSTLAVPIWQDAECHRSGLSAQVQAALALERYDPRTSVTLVFRSCTGALADSPSDAHPGVQQAQEALELIKYTNEFGEEAYREVDAVVMSFGGNDAGFAPVIKKCIYQEPCSSSNFELDPLVDTAVESICLTVAPLTDVCYAALGEIEAEAEGQSALALFRQSLSSLEPHYVNLDQVLGGLPGVDLDRARVFITEYPNATQDEQGRICGPRTDRVDPFMNMIGFSPAEWQWSAESVTENGLNIEVHDAALAHGWTMVTGIFDDFASHGYCSDNNWFVRLQDSLLRQLDIQGTLHPNTDGHAAIAQRLFAALRERLYRRPTELGDAPRPPLEGLAPWLMWVSATSSLL